MKRPGRSGPAGLLLAAALLAGCGTTTPSPPAIPPDGTTGPQVTDAATNAASTPGTAIAVPRTSPCDLVFRDEAAGLLGLPIEDTQRSETVSQDGSSWIGGCLFLRRSGDDLAPLDVALGIGTPYVDAFAALGSSPGVVRIDLGDDALLRLADVWGLAGPAGSLLVRYGDAVLSFSLGISDLTDGVPAVPGDAAAQEAILRKLAALALGRLTTPSTAVATCDFLDAAAVSALGGPGVTKAENVDNQDVWGPGCAYLDAGGVMRLYVAVSDRASAVPNFDTCIASNLQDAIPGLGDAAYFTDNCEVVAKFKYMGNPMVVARLGATVVAVTMPPPTGGTFEEFEALQAWIKAVAQGVLAKLGAGPAVTPAPTSSAVDPLAHPCGLLTDAEASAGVKVPVTATREDPGVPGYPAHCFFLTLDYALAPLDFTIGQGADAVSAFAAYAASPAEYLPVPGLGDAAYQQQAFVYGVNDTKMVKLYVRRGDTVISLFLGGTHWLGQPGKDAGGPGDVTVQLAILRQFAELILSRL